MILASLERAYPIRLIASFPVITCDANHLLAPILHNPELAPFDYLPAVLDGRTTGVLYRRHLSLELQDPGPDIVVGDVMRRLDDTMLMAVEEGVLSFITTAGDLDYRLILDRQAVTGIVTVADIQKLAARPVLFLLATHLELQMAEIIRSRCSSPQQWLSHLNPERATKVQAKYAELKAQNLAIDELTATDFADKRDILWRLKLSTDGSKSAFDRDFKEIETLRNSVAHGGDYALSKEAATVTIGRARTAINWAGKLRQLL